jgi:hypothetical protein
MRTLFGLLLDPDGLHTHTRSDCPRVRRLHPGELRAGLTTGRLECPSCAELASPAKSRPAGA